MDPAPIRVGGAHDALTAILVEEAGFDAVWASGFEISAAHGVPDANILTMTNNLYAGELMAERCGIPVIADLDSGYGNAVNVIHTVRAYEKAGIAAVCIEDNDFPKRCSFYAGVRRELVDPEEHAGKIRACLDTRKSEDFMVIARTEALIAGWGMEEALLRGHCYADAGADMILVHSKEKTANEVLEFADQWDRDTPLVCVPTTYNSTHVDVLARGGYRVVIYANQGLRSAIRAARAAFAGIIEAGHASAVDEQIVPMTDVYELIGVPEMREQEASYLPKGRSAASVAKPVRATGSTGG
jgi:phosphoenolpyruvate phosphomutase